MACWIISVTPEEYEVCVEEGAIAFPVPHRAVLEEQMEVGDRLSFRIDPKGLEADEADEVEGFRGLAEVTGEFRFEEEEADPWADAGGQARPGRRDVAFEETEAWVSIHRLLGSLSFLPNEVSWTLAFAAGFRKVSDEDFTKVERALD